MSRLLAFIVITFILHYNAVAQDAVYLNNEKSNNNIPLVQTRLALIKTVLASNTPVILLTNLNAQAQQIQEIALLSPTLKRNFFQSRKGNKLLNEIFSIRPTLPSDDLFDAAFYKVEAYNYAYNLSLVMYINKDLKTIVKEYTLPQSSPEIPEALKKIAVAIAINDAQVIKDLGPSFSELNAEMAYTKSALNKSRCERSQHLCVAPTFVKGNKALWCIVDLTDLALVGTRWTNVGIQDTVHISERSIQNEKIVDCYCKKTNSLNKNDWQFSYLLTSSDGLKIENLTYKNKAILKSAKLVDYKVSYSNSEGFGYSDGIGCPMYSLSAVVAWDEPKLMDLTENGETIGFVLEQKFQSEGWPRACNYNYLQRYEFYNDGRFRVSTASIGRGCGSDGTYRPIIRIAFAGNNSFSQFQNNNYTNWSKEKWHLQNEATEYSKEGNLFKIDGAVNYFMQPARKQFNDNGRGDNAFTYVTVNKALEGEGDLITLSPCCNVDYHQGPEKFIEDKFGSEAIENKELVVWYVPQMKNDDRPGFEHCWAEAKIINGVYTTTVYPCFAGPMFIPIELNK
jgi:hypothetical protein